MLLEAMLLTRKSAAKVVFAIYFDSPPFVVLENQFEQREWQHGLITKNVRDKGTWE
jgi:hypothetical protein